MNRNKSILIITPGFPENEIDDTCIPPLQEFLIEFKNAYPEIKFFIIALQYPFKKCKYAWNDIPVYSCGGKNKKFPLRFFSWVKAFLYFIEIKKNNKLDIIHSFWFGEAVFLGNIFSSFFKIHHVNTLMGRDALKENKYLELISKKKIKIVPISKRQKKIFQKSTRKEILDSIPFGISNRNGNFIQRKREIDILGVGSLIELKNYKFFMELIKELTNDYPDLNCVLIGEGVQRDFLLELAKKLGIENNIHFKGKLSRKEVFDFMRKGKIFFHPSKYESLGYVFEEALISGLSIVSFETGIAEPSEKWKVCKTNSEIYNSLKYFLENNHDFNPLVLYKIEETVNSYYRIYELI